VRLADVVKKFGPGTSTQPERVGNMATEAPREKLKELMEKNGDGLLQDRDRCEGLLKD
jgi:hypothetical protein